MGYDHQIYKRDYQQIEDTKKDSYRLKYHLMPFSGWMNDPNGLCKYHGTYYLCYQYSPDVNGGLKYWGCYSTKDFQNYTDEGIVIFPDCEWDADGAYSGSALCLADNVYVCYTGNVKKEGNYDYVLEGREQNTISMIFSEGKLVQKKNCILRNKDYGEEMSLHVRDPKVIYDNGRFYMILGARKKDDTGCALLYCSKDFETWEKKTVFHAEEMGYMWECPDIVQLKDKTFLMCCPQRFAKGKNGSEEYFTGYFELENGLESDGLLNDFQRMDYGYDYYAPQSFMDGERVIQIGWMGMTENQYENPTVENNWQHAMTLPRELTYKEGIIYQYPIDEILNLQHDMQNVVMIPEKEYTFASICGSLSLKGMKEQFYLKLRDDFEILYKDQSLNIRMGKSGYGRPETHIPLKHLEYIDIFSDTSSLEIFINKGEAAFTTRIYDSLQMKMLSNQEITVEYCSMDDFHITCKTE